MKDLLGCKRTFYVDSLMKCGTDRHGNHFYEGHFTKETLYEEDILFDIHIYGYKIVNEQLSRENTNENM